MSMLSVQLFASITSFIKYLQGTRVKLSLYSSYNDMVNRSACQLSRDIRLNKGS